MKILKYKCNLCNGPISDGPAACSSGLALRFPGGVLTPADAWSVRDVHVCWSCAERLVDLVDERWSAKQAENRKAGEAPTTTDEAGPVIRDANGRDWAWDHEAISRGAAATVRASLDPPEPSVAEMVAAGPLRFDLPASGPQNVEQLPDFLRRQP